MKKQQTRQRMLEIGRTRPWFAVPCVLGLIAGASSGCGLVDVVDAAPSQTEAEATGRLATREVVVAEREQQIADRETRLAERDAELADRSDQMAATGSALQVREQALEARQEKLTRRAAEVAARETALARRQAELDTSEARLAKDRQALAETRARVERESERGAEAVSRQPPPAVYAEVDLRADTLLDIEFMTTVSSATSRPGDTFTTRLTRDVLAGDGRLVIPAGTELVGVVTEATSLRRVGGQAELGLRFGELQLPWGRQVEINAAFFDESRNESRRDKKVIGRAAAGGAILGTILDDDDRGRGAVLGAILGAAAGTAASANRTRDEVVIPGGTVVTLELEEAVSVEVPWKSQHAAP